MFKYLAVFFLFKQDKTNYTECKYIFVEFTFGKMKRNENRDTITFYYRINKS